MKKPQKEEKKPKINPQKDQNQQNNHHQKPRKNKPKPTTKALLKSVQMEQGRGKGKKGRKMNINPCGAMDCELKDKMWKTFLKIILNGGTEKIILKSKIHSPQRSMLSYRLRVER